MNIFQNIAGRRPRKNKFDLSHERKFSFAMGKLTPILVQDVVPGDKFRVKSEVFLRMAPMLAPIMHRVNVYTHYFFVPNRLVWDEWEDFITGGREGNASPVAPYFNTNTLHTWNALRTATGSLWDYMGLPIIEGTPPVASVPISALPFRAYQKIFNEYYRDQNLEAEIEFSVASGQITDTAELSRLTYYRDRAWEKDYFTSALPWAQRGGDVSVPFEAQVNYKDVSDVILSSSGNPYGLDANLTTEFGDPGKLRAEPAGASSQVRIENIEDIDSASVTINELRRSVRLQEWLEKNARGGARYVEQILSHFGVRSSDARLQRPEYLGGGRQPLQVSEVLSTFQESAGSGNPLATMAGHGVAVGNTNGFSKFFEEHGYVIGLMSVIPKTAYQQGIPRHMSRFDKFDYYWPEFAQIGEQEVKNKELYYGPTETPTNLEGTFGYQSRYAEYKYQASSVHGEFRDSLAFWHMGRIFESAPALNASFVRSNPTDRIFAVEDAEQMYCQLYNNVSAIRPMPYFGTPTL